MTTPAPLFAIGEVVYLAASTALGELEAYKITALTRSRKDTWVYRIEIDQKGPQETSVGGRIDLKSPARLEFEEEELLLLCDAVDAAINSVSVTITRLQFKNDGLCEATGIAEPVLEAGAPKFSVGDKIFMRASAAIGFLEQYEVENVHKIPSSTEFSYDLDLTKRRSTIFDEFGGIRFIEQPQFRDPIFFKERELVTECEALILALEALDRKMSRLLNVKLRLCTEELTPDGTGTA